MNKLILASVFSLGLTASLLATSISISPINGGAATGSSNVNFDSLLLGNGNQVVNANLNLSFAGTAKVVQGASGEYAAPFVSGGNGFGFGSPNQPNGVDSTNYLSTGIGSVSFLFNSSLDYFGLLWGSVDNYNTLSFYDGSTLIQSFTGAQVWASANGDQGQQGTFYVNFNAINGGFNKVVASSTQNAFELDNVAYGAKNVPDHGSTGIMVGVALLGLAVRRKFF